ncbi:MAG: glycosyltransferase [Eubacteriales bacterium]|nr:glycosyltransferase [Eubacteriales bacterium]
MKVLIVNPILYTNENRNIKKVNTIKDTMIYDLCLAFLKKGCDVTLAASDLYKPSENESYPFNIIWMRTRLTKLFPPHTLPYCPEVKKIAKSGNFDLIITSEVFSLNSLSLAVHSYKNLIVWQELGKHNRIMHGYASKIWYGIIAKMLFRKALIVARSEQAKKFISKYCKNVSDEIIDHGVNTKKFIPETKKDNQFAISSQLIKRKQIDKSITAFANYLKKYDSSAKLYIMGDGDEKENLRKLTKDLSADKNIIFTGKLGHNELIEILKKSIAMLVYTQSDLNMVSIVESLSLATPVITTSVPYCSSYIESESLGIVDDNWNEDDLRRIATSDEYINNCMNYRKYLPTEYKAEQFLKVKGLIL